MTQSREINHMNYPTKTLAYQQAKTSGPSHANGSQPMVCRYIHIWVYVTAGDLWLITSQPTVSGNISEEHSQMHDSGKCLCCQSNKRHTAWLYQIYGEGSTPKTCIKAITRVHPTFTFQFPIGTKSWKFCWNHGITLCRCKGSLLVKHRFNKFTWH
jgi:hypothetical protein